MASLRGWLTALQLVSCEEALVEVTGMDDLSEWQVYVMEDDLDGMLERGMTKPLLRKLQLALKGLHSQQRLDKDLTSKTYKAEEAVASSNSHPSADKHQPPARTSPPEVSEQLPSTVSTVFERGSRARAQPAISSAQTLTRVVKEIKAVEKKAVAIEATKKQTTAQQPPPEKKALKLPPPEKKAAKLKLPGAVDVDDAEAERRRNREARFGTPAMRLMQGALPDRGAPVGKATSSSSKMIELPTSKKRGREGAKGGGGGNWHPLWDDRDGPMSRTRGSWPPPSGSRPPPSGSRPPPSGSRPPVSRIADADSEDDNWGAWGSSKSAPEKEKEAKRQKKGKSDGASAKDKPSWSSWKAEEPEDADDDNWGEWKPKETKDPPAAGKADSAAPAVAAERKADSDAPAAATEEASDEENEEGAVPDDGYEEAAKEPRDAALREALQDALSEESFASGASSEEESASKPS